MDTQMHKGLSTRLKNLFNFNALNAGLMTAIGIGAMAVVSSFDMWNGSWTYNAAPYVVAASAGLSALWNAYAVGNQTFIQSPFLHKARNYTFTGASTIGGLVTGLVAAQVITLGYAGDTTTSLGVVAGGIYGFLSNSMALPWQKSVPNAQASSPKPA